MVQSNLFSKTQMAFYNLSEQANIKFNIIIIIFWQLLHKLMGNI